MEDSPEITEKRFSTLAEAREGYEKLQEASEAMIEELTATNEKTRAELEQAESALEEVNEKHAEAITRIEFLEGCVDILEGDVQEQTDNLQREAAAIAASVGVEPVPVVAESSPDPEPTAWEKYQALNGVEKSQYFAENKDAIIAAAKQADA